MTRCRRPLMTYPHLMGRDLAQEDAVLAELGRSVPRTDPIIRNFQLRRAVKFRWQPPRRGSLLGGAL